MIFKRRPPNWLSSNEKSSSSYFAKLELVSFIRVNECRAHFVSLQTKNVHRSVVDTVRAQV